ncbi:hypothetical protein CALCODRAFT_28731 [Calocera cornea HHB12733]|uniref:Uncharacterized protein n=1 Tax=Calocera cornea HHB12733 TaxID=1353952 RepID=A0A165E3F4_9BASI|nr:hypothetical protein CALCODRAFT_28731 [Calocera cornea HHB12733]
MSCHDEAFRSDREPSRAPRPPENLACETIHSPGTLTDMTAGMEHTQSKCSLAEVQLKAVSRCKRAAQGRGHAPALAGPLPTARRAPGAAIGRSAEARFDWALLVSSTRSTATPSQAPKLACAPRPLAPAGHRRHL